MSRLLAVAAAVGLAAVMPAGSARAGCRLEVTTCNVACPDPRDIKTGICKQRCHTIICETKSRRLAKSHLPKGDLPSDQLPQGHMPDSHLPD